MDASREGCGGTIVGTGKACLPTVFRLGWPDDIRRMLVTKSNPGGTLCILEFEMAGMLVLFLVMEAVCSLGAGMQVQ